MGRARYRSASGGSLTEMTTSTQPSSYQPQAMEAAKDLFGILIGLRNVHGKSFLHNNSEIGMAQSLLERATRLDQAASSSFLERLLLAPDVESGYTPLHWAIMEGNLAAVLQILRHVLNRHDISGQQHGRMAQRPMNLLQADFVVVGDNDLLVKIAQAKDHEGLNPLDLLCRLQRTELANCRQSLAAILPAGYSDPRRRSVFEPDESMDNEFHVLQEDATPNLPESCASCDYGCEVLTFGRVNHCALGGGGGAGEKNATASHQVRPLRVQAFGLSDLGKDQSAVAVAAAAHHTLVATRNGRLYAFGLGKGGRLGTGDERHRPVPTRVLGPLARRRIVAVAAAENHSLCITSDGSVYAWGSNRFGQLGSTVDDSKGTVDSQRCLPRRVDNLKHVCCVSVAAGDRHSVALSNQGEVYTWGDNQAGQLGIILRGSIKSTTSTRGQAPTGGNGQQVNRVDALWLASPRRVTVAISAAAQSTLVLTCPSRAAAALPTNTVYAWGHGNHVPIRVNFSSTSNDSNSSLGGTSYLMGKRHVNPVAIACAKYHNAAIAEDGRVFTWGLHTEPLGTSHKAKHDRFSRSMVIASPQLVTGMLPENGGGLAVAISACENHTAVLTDCGHLYTWGATYGKDVLGHEGVSWQPSPKKVPGVYRAVGVASAKEHTVLLIGTSFPQTPAKSKTCPSLETLAARRIVQHVDLFNVIPILVIAERTNCSFLIDYCQEFIRLNLDGVLTLGKKSEMGRYLSDKLADGAHRTDGCDRDASYHPLVNDIVGSVYNKAWSSQAMSDEHFWMESCKVIFDRLPISLISKNRAMLNVGERISEGRVGKSRRDRAFSFSGENASSSTTKQSDSVPSEAGTTSERCGFKGCSERCMMLTADVHLTTVDSARCKYDCLSKEVRSVRKRLNQISKLEQTCDGAVSLTPEQKEKLGRRPLLEADLEILERTTAQVEVKLRSLDIAVRTMSCAPSDTDACMEALEEKPGTPKDCLDAKSSESNDLDVDTSLPPFRCEICRISCPDSNSFALHKSGRKHRNRVSQTEEEDRKKTAAFMMETKRRQLLMTEPERSTATLSPWKKKDSSLSVQPKFKLPPPPTFPSPETKSRPSPQPTGIKSWSNPVFPPSRRTAGAKKSSSFRSILDEEEKRANVKIQHKSKVLPFQSSLSSSRTSPGAREAPPSPVRRMPPVFNLGKGGSDLSDSASNKSHSLGDFLVSPSAAHHTAPRVAAPWSESLSSGRSSKSAATSAKSFIAIQQEEQDLRTKQDQSCGMDGHWYIARRERAGSISKIQEEEAREREHELLVEEQKRIEEEITRERQREKKQGKPTKRNNRHRKSKNKQQTGSNQKQDSSNGGSDGKEPAKRSGNRRKARQGKRGDATRSSKAAVQAQP